MGVPQEDCLKIAELIGVKSMLNEFVAFERLGILISNGALFSQRDVNAPIVFLPNGDWNVTLQNTTEITLKHGALYVSFVSSFSD